MAEVGAVLVVLGSGLDNPAAQQVCSDPEPQDEQRTREAGKDACNDWKHVPHDRLEATCDGGNGRWAQRLERAPSGADQ